MSPELGFWCGGYTASMGGDAQGIALLSGESAGGLEFRGLAAAVSSPSYLLRHGGGVVAADEANGRVVFFALEGGELVERGSRSTTGPNPCHLSVDDGLLFASNYGDGSIDVFAIAADGAIEGPLQTLAAAGSGPLPQQDGPHAHCTLPLPGGTVLSADLGTDRVHLHSRHGEELRRIASIELPAGTGPRDLLRLGSRTLLLGEFGSRIFEIGADAVAGSGELVADPVEGDQAAGLAVSDDGRFLYAGLRGSDRIAVVDAVTLEPVAAVSCGGHWPRHLVVRGGLLLVANQLSGTVSRFAIDARSGIPSPLGAPILVPSPTFLLPLA